jgi:hypothetical protein
LPQPVQRQDELRAKNPAGCAGVMTRPVTSKIVSASSSDGASGPGGPSSARPRKASTDRLHCNTAARADSILPMGPSLPAR